MIEDDIVSEGGMEEKGNADEVDGGEMLEVRENESPRWASVRSRFLIRLSASPSRTLSHFYITDNLKFHE